MAFVSARLALDEPLGCSGWAASPERAARRRLLSRFLLRLPLEFLPFADLLRLSGRHLDLAWGGRQRIPIWRN